MKKITALFTLLALLVLVGCGNSKIDGKLKELERKPAATDLEGAKALYQEANNFLRWIEQKENPSQEQLARTKALVKKREEEGFKLLAEKAKSKILGALGGLTGVDGSVDFGKAKDWFLGTKDPRVEKFGGPPTEPTKDGGSKGWK